MYQHLIDPSSRRELEVIEALMDDDWQVRAAAAMELEAIGAEAVAAVPVLIRMLEAGPAHWYERKAAVDALVAITGCDLWDVPAWLRWWRERRRD